MDFSSIFLTLFKQLWFFIPLFALLAVFRTAWFKGVAGEWMVNLAAQLRLDKHQYQLIKNVTLPAQDGTTQIDHIIVAETGMFVVETKNMKG